MNDHTFHNSAERFIQAIDHRWEKFVEAFDAHCHNLVEQLGNLLGAGVNKLADKAAQAGTSAVNRVDRVADRFSPTHTPSVPRSHQPSPSQTPKIEMAPHIVASAKEATVGMPRIQVAEMHGHSHNFAPSATPSLGHGQSMGFGIGV